MDPKILLMAGLLVVMLVAFGRNPIEDGKPVVKDRFRTSLEERLTKSNSLSKAGNTEQTGVISSILGDETGVIGTQQPMPGGTPVNQPLQQGMGLPGNPTPPTQPTIIQGGNGNPYDLPGSYRNTPPNPFGGQADPATRYKAQAALQSGSAGVPAEQGPSYFLKDGRRVFFSGFKVFVLGRDGNLIALRDGRYELQSGDPLVIRNGRRAASKN